MDQTQSSRRKLLLIVFSVSVIIIMAFSVFHSMSGGRPVTLHISQPVAAHVEYPYLTAADQLNYFTGSTFASLNTTSQTTKNLTPYYRLPHVTSVKWGKQAALFSANAYATNDMLYEILAGKQLDTTGSYWWLVDFTTGKISLVSSNTPYSRTTGAVWQPDGVHYVSVELIPSEEEADTQLVCMATATTACKPDDLNQDTPLIRNLLWADSEKFYFSTDDGSVYGYRLGSDAHTLISKQTANSAVISPDGTRLAFISQGPELSEGTGSSLPTGSLVMQNLTNSKQTTVVKKDFYAKVVWSSISPGWASVDSSSRHGYFAGNPGKPRPLELVTDTSLTGLSVVGVTSDSLILSGDNNTLYLATKQPVTSLKPLSGDKAPKKAVTLSYLPYENDHYKMTYELVKSGSTETPTINITLYGILNRPSQLQSFLAQLKDYQAEAMEYIKSHGDDPSKFTLNFAPNPVTGGASLTVPAAK